MPRQLNTVDFAGVDEIDKTLKSGFDSLIGITDQILVALKKGIITEGYETPAPAVNVTENTVASSIPSVTIETSTTQIPAIESRCSLLWMLPICSSLTRLLNVAPITNPVLQVPDMDIPAIDNPVMHIPSVEIPELALDAPLIDLPMVAVQPVADSPSVLPQPLPSVESPSVDLPALAVGTPVVNVTENTIPELALDTPVIDLPALAVDTPVVNLSGIQTPEGVGQCSRDRLACAGSGHAGCQPLRHPDTRGVGQCSRDRLACAGSGHARLSTSPASRHQRRWSMFPR